MQTIDVTLLEEAASKLSQLAQQVADAGSLSELPPVSDASVAVQVAVDNAAEWVVQYRTKLEQLAA